MNGKRAPIFAQSRDLATDTDDPLRAGRQIALEVPVVFFVVRSGHQDIDVSAEDLGARVPEQSFRRWIKGLDASATVDDDDAVDSGLDDGGQNGRVVPRRGPRRFGHSYLKERTR